MAYYVVRESDHLARIAQRHGVSPNEVWTHDANKALRRKRGDGSILRAGDLLFLPDAPPRERVTISAGATKTFQAQVARVPFRLRLTERGRPIAGEPYRLETPGDVIHGTTDGDGTIDTEVRVFVGRANLLLERRKEIYAVDFGGMDPASELTGVQMRLRHLGHYVGDIHGRLDEPTREALLRFQAARHITETGEADEATIAELTTAHGC